jgi:hypothetical protein
MAEKKDTLQEAKDRFKLCSEWLSDIHKAQRKDISFFRGVQWDPADLKDRSDDKRPALVINKLPATVQQVANNIRKNKIEVKIRPVDSVTDPKTADVINGLIRNINNNSDVKAAMDCALEAAIIGGLGFFRVITDYSDPMSMDQELKVERLPDPLKVYFPIPLIKKADWSDAPYAFIRTSMSRDAFKIKYGKKAADEIADWDSQTDTDPNWSTEEEVYLAEYYVIEETPKTLYQLDDGTTTIEKPEPTVVLDDLGMAHPGPQIVAERETVIKKTKWYLLSEHTILDEKDWPSQYVPIIPITGWELIDDGKKYYMSLIRHSLDCQKLYNFYRSQECELIGLAPKAPWLVAAGQIENFEQQWKVVNKKPLAYIEYNPVSTQQGLAVNPPQRIDGAVVPIAMITAMKEAGEEIKDTSGIYAANLGQPSNESSGKAIIARQRMGDNSSYHFQASLDRAVNLMGKIFIEVIPAIIDVPRAIRILGEDQVEKVVMVNQLHYDEESGENKLYDLTVGKYDVVTSVGPSYESRRMEVAENITNIMTAMPNLGQYAGDILVRSLDFPGSEELAERLRRTIPPQILEDPNSKPNKISDADVQMIIQDLQNLQQTLNMTTQQNMQLNAMVEGYKKLLADKTADIELKRDTAIINATTQIKTQQMKTRQELIKAQDARESEDLNLAIKLSGRGAPAPSTADETLE